jgi:hypothetical protein
MVVLPVVLTISGVGIIPLDLISSNIIVILITAGNGIQWMADLGAETVILGLLVLVAVVLSVSAVVSEFVFVWAGHVGVLEIAVVLLLVSRSRIFTIRNNSGHNGAQNQNLKFVIWVFRIKNNQPGGIQLKLKPSKKLRRSNCFNSPQEKSSCCWRMKS